MHNALCDVYGMDVPIFAFSHSPAVVLAVTKAGGFGVLGAAGLEPEELHQALKYISQECAGKAFGIDFIIPDNYVGSDQGGLTIEELQKHTHRDTGTSWMDCLISITSHQCLRLTRRSPLGPGWAFL
jgi:NAD(P)H-dependent flavin oxidoreductase YrpB (nitropropane dioxygenase family)